VRHWNYYTIANRDLLQISISRMPVVKASVEEIGDFCNPNPVQNFHWVIRSELNLIHLSKYSIQSGLYPKKTLIKHLTAVINSVSISISDPVEFFSKSSPIRIRFWIAESGWIAIRKPGHVQHWSRLFWHYRTVFRLPLDFCFWIWLASS